jgi:hypothetical protein
MMAQQVVSRIFDFSGSALGEMMVRGEETTLRRRFRDILLLTASAAVFTGVSVAICNASFLALWLKGEIRWAWQNDMLMGVLLMVNCVSRCYVNLAGYAKQVRRMRWIYFLEGTSFFISAAVIAPHFGFTGIIAVAILANLACTGMYGIRWAARYLRVGMREIVFGWLLPASGFFLVMAPLTALIRLATASLPPLPQFLLSSCLMALVGLPLFWRLGLTEELRRDLKAGLVRLGWRK